MAIPTSLWQLNVDETARVHALRSSGLIRRRLQDIGLIQGTLVRCLYKSPSGDPVAYGIRGAVIALRSEEALGVQVERVSVPCG